MTTPTPGPWRAVHGRHDYFYVYTDGLETDVLIGGSVGAAWESRTALANARLLASAPDLLAALAELVRLKDNPISPGGTGDDAREAAWQAARDALTQARGES